MFVSGTKVLVWILSMFHQTSPFWRGKVLGFGKASCAARCNNGVITLHLIFWMKSNKLRSISPSCSSTNDKSSMEWVIHGDEHDDERVLYHDTEAGYHSHGKRNIMITETKMMTMMWRRRTRRRHGEEEQEEERWEEQEEEKNTCKK